MSYFQLFLSFSVDNVTLNVVNQIKSTDQNIKQAFKQTAGLFSVEDSLSGCPSMQQAQGGRGDIHALL